MSLTYAISGYQLSATTLRYGMWLQQGTEYAPSLSPNHTALTVPNWHYEIPNWSDTLQAITLSLVIRLRYETPAKLRGGWDMLMRRLGMGSNGPVELTRIRDGETNYADAQLISSTAPDFSSETNELTTTIVFNIPGGAWRGPLVNEIHNNGANQRSTLAEDSTLPITDALLRAIGPMSSLFIKDNLSNTGVTWGQLILGGSVPAGKMLLIDVGAMDAAIVSTDTWDLTSGTPAAASLTFLGNGPLSLTSRLTGSGTTPTSSVSITIGGTGNQLIIRSRKALV